MRDPRLVAALLFDFNGTLSDDEGIQCAIFRELFAEQGRPLLEQEYFDVLAGRSDPEIVERWHREIVRIVALPDVNQRLRTLGFDPVANSPAEFAERIRSEGAKWDKVAKEAKIVLE